MEKKLIEKYFSHHPICECYKDHYIKIPFLDIPLCRGCLFLITRFLISYIFLLLFHQYFKQIFLYLILFLFLIPPVCRIIFLIPSNMKFFRSFSRLSLGISYCFGIFLLISSIKESRYIISFILVIFFLIMWFFIQKFSKTEEIYCSH